MLLVSLCCPDFVSICNVWRLFGPVTVTDRDGRLAAAERSCSVTGKDQKSFYLLRIETKAGRGAERSCSVTTRGSKTVFLLQIKTFVSGGNGDDGPFV